MFQVYFQGLGTQLWTLNAKLDHGSPTTIKELRIKIRKPVQDAFQETLSESDYASFRAWFEKKGNNNRDWLKIAAERSAPFPGPQHFWIQTETQNRDVLPPFGAVDMDAVFGGATAGHGGGRRATSAVQGGSGGGGLAATMPGGTGFAPSGFFAASATVWSNVDQTMHRSESLVPTPPAPGTGGMAAASGARVPTAGASAPAPLHPSPRDPSVPVAAAAGTLAQTSTAAPAAGQRAAALSLASDPLPMRRNESSASKKTSVLSTMPLATCYATPPSAQVAEGHEDLDKKRK